MENNTIVVTDEKGKEVKCRVLFTVEDEKTGKNYVVYTDDKKTKDGRIKTYASIYKIDSMESDDMDLFPIETEEEWKFIENILEKLQPEEEEK